VIELELPASADACYAAFCDGAQLRLWLPALKRMKVAKHDARGRPIEVMFELGDALSFALVYAYDDAARRVRWVPSAGVLDGVSGFATFTPSGSACRLMYSLDSMRGRAPDHEAEVARAFAAYLSPR
jgi:hypothetical protein